AREGRARRQRQSPDARRRAQADARGRAARGARPERRPPWLRAGRVRRLHRAPRRRARARLPRLRRAGARLGGDHGRGPGRAGRDAAPAAAGVLRPLRDPVRLLHARHAAVGALPARARARADARADSRGAGGEHLPLHRLRSDRRRGRGGRPRAAVIRTELIRPVGELLAAHSPERVALEDGELQVTYGELELRTRRLAAHLAAAGIEPGDRVATYMANGVRGAEAQLAAVRAGAIAVPINPAAPAAEAGFMLADSGARALVVDPERRHELGGASELALVAVAGESYEELVSSDAPGRAEPGDLDAPAWMLYTSGTTGRPKGVLLSQRGLLWVAACWGSIVGISDEDVILSPLPQFHSYCTELHLAALAAGARVRITRRFSTSETLDLLASRPFTLLAGVPTMFHYLLEAGRKQGLRCPTLARCVSAGAILPAALSDEFERTFGVLLLDGYGITETSTFVTM